MHSDLYCEDYFDPKLEGEILSEVDVSEGRKRWRLLLLVVIVVFIL